MRLILDPVEVETEDAKPKVVYWQGRRYEVEEVVEGWIYRGKWWATEEKRYYVTVQTGRGTLELYRKDGAWTLSRVMD